MLFCATVDDVCLDGYSTADHFAALLDFFGEQGVRATFFTVPRSLGIPIDLRKEYIPLLRRAVREGHDIAQHGLEHDRFETGIPPRMILDLPHEGPARERLANDRAAIEASLRTEQIRERLQTGRTILQDSLGSHVVGFRAPCCSTCPNLFDALEAEGFRYDSSRFLQETGWDIINDRQPIVPRPITRETHDAALYPGRMRTFPLTTEYTWYPTWKKFDVTMDLAKHDFTACLRAGIPFVPVAHVSPVFEGEDGCGLEFYRRLLDFARQEAKASGQEVRAVTLREACDTESGAGRVQ